jgi:RNA polymerase sigma-54 factor
LRIVDWWRAVLHLRLEQRQTQKLVITPQLRQAIKLLQLSALELQSYIENEIRENPLLSVEEGVSADGLDAGPPDEFTVNGLSEPDGPVFDARDSGAIEIEPQWEPEANEYSPAGAPLAPLAPQNGAEWLADSHAARASASSDDYDPFASLTQHISLADHLSQQAQLAFPDPKDHFVAGYLIDLVDASGYIRGSLDEVAASLGLPLSQVERILSTLQTFDPPGVCARTLAECLTLQLKERNRFDPYMERLVAHLDLVAVCDYARLRKLCAVDAEDLSDMIAEIRGLNPRPGSAFEKLTVEALVPDVIVRRGPDGSWRAELNPSATPCLAVDRAYYASLKARCRSDADRSYLSDRLSSANWLVKSLEQRLSTILKVAAAVVEEQAAFFDQGVRHLKPLNLRQIAVKIGVHESTVSRVTSNKAIATPRGLFEMKYFFTSAISAAGAANGAHSSEAVRDRIKELICNESPGEVLSDDRIVTMLKDSGINIARRTVAKYRDALRIPSSAARRRQKRAQSAA